MNLNYDQVTGHISKDDGEVIATGWAGNGEGKNNPALQAERNVGPLPQGLYQVGEWEYEHNGLGHDVVALLQVEGETFDRSGFFIHGPSVNLEHYGQESKGCIVVPRDGRLVVKSLNPDFVKVFASVVPEVAPVETTVEQVANVVSEGASILSDVVDFIHPTEG